MSRSAFFTTVDNKNNPILIVDTKGLIGENLAAKIQQEIEVILVSPKKPSLNKIIHIPYKNNLHQIPDNVFSHIIVIDEKIEYDKKTVDFFIKRAKKDNSLLLFIVDYEQLNSKTYLASAFEQEQFKIGVYGDVFGTKSVIGFNNTINTILEGIKREWKINIPGDGTGEVYPVLIDDLIDAILEISFSENKEKLFLIYPQNKITLLTFAAAFKKIHPEIRLNFVEEAKRQKKGLPQLTGRYILGENYSLIDKIKKIDLDPTDQIQLKPQVKKIKNKNSIFLTTVFLFSLVILPLIFVALLSFTQKIITGYTKTQLDNGNLEYTSIIYQSTKFLQPVFIVSDNILKTEFGFFNNGNTFKNLENNFNNYTALEDVYGQTSNFLITFSNILTGQSKNVGRDLASSMLLYKNAHYNLYLLGNTNRTTSLTNLYSLTPTTDFWADNIAYNTSSSYLLLVTENPKSFSRNSILSSYATFDMKNGKIENFNPNNLSNKASLSAVLTNLNPQDKIQGLIIVNKDFQNQFNKILTKQNASPKKYLSLELVNYVINQIKEKNMIIIFNNKNEQAIFNLIGL